LVWIYLFLENDKKLVLVIYQALFKAGFGDIFKFEISNKQKIYFEILKERKKERKINKCTINFISFDIFLLGI